MVSREAGVSKIQARSFRTLGSAFDFVMCMIFSFVCELTTLLGMPTSVKLQIALLTKQDAVSLCRVQLEDTASAADEGHPALQNGFPQCPYVSIVSRTPCSPYIIAIVCYHTSVILTYISNFLPYVPATGR